MKNFLNILLTIRWQDLVDILVNSYILFRLYVLFRHTNAFRILVGIASLWVIQEVAASLGLILTSWALQAITAAAAIIIIVVFRNEIRTALQARNLKNFLWGSPLMEKTSAVQLLADTFFQMGKKRMGALAVFPGKEDLSELVHGGIPWDGRVSQEMLMSIFWPRNPVHDGAAVIEGDKITQVGVLLPLSQRTDLPTFYGTRHRAAAGLAERSDALVVVVSEERGRVSVAKQQWIRPISKPEEVAHLLEDHLGTDHEKDVNYRRREMGKLTLAALLSLVIMTAVWFGFTRGGDTLIAVDVPIELVNRPPQYQILETSANKVHLQLHGSSALVKSMRPEQINVRIDLSKAEEGRNVFALTQESIQLPPGVFFNAVSPTTVEVVLDVPATKSVPVQVDWTGRLPDDLILTEVQVIPSEVQVVGGKTILKDVHTLYTTPVRLGTITQSGELSVPIIVSPSSLKLASSENERVRILFTVAKRAAPTAPPAGKPRETAG
ncbi:TIGR00159 family protein [Desulfacinum hydrothermale DSM 13146]|uniref:Diadenylate cyclase n=1 Tax=Desulfacinum hydrothermale DSM 13146 TaxID=1121390 RepID=A0A1W1XAI0_9BACT|nr:diadenylate cyclase [Desulfacinum hydrothermale]SMC20922.1 TIGR00159 family protein [Desulfacinum hydrothermale DSM 13146]